MYRIVGSFHRIQFSVHAHAHYVCTVQPIASLFHWFKAVKTEPLENFPLYSINLIEDHQNNSSYNK